jgi:hypothetical protein
MKIKLTDYRNWLIGEREAVEATTVTLSENIMALAQVVGMLSLPAVPATLVAIALHTDLTDTLPPVLLWPVVAIVGAGLEALGITASKTAMRMYRAFKDQMTTRGELLTSILTVFFYITLTGIILYNDDSLTGLASALSLTSPLLSVTLYVVTGFNTDLQRREEKRKNLEERKEQISHEMELADVEDHRKRLEMKREQEMIAFKAQQEAKLQKVLAKATTPQLSAQERDRVARQLLRQNPNISGVDLARQLGVSDRMGQIIKSQISSNGGPS